MSNSLRTYSPKEVAVTLFGYNLEGFADGTFVEAERNSANTEYSVGADSKVGLTYVGDFTGMLRLTLQQTSESNIALSAIQNAQDAAGEIIRFNGVITDPSGGSLVRMKNIHIMSPPPVTLGKSQEDKTWEFFIEDLRYVDAPPGVVQGAAVAANIEAIVNTAIEQSNNIADSASE